MFPSIEFKNRVNGNNDPLPVDFRAKTCTFRWKYFFRIVAERVWLKNIETLNGELHEWKIMSEVSVLVSRESFYAGRKTKLLSSINFKNCLSSFRMSMLRILVDTSRWFFSLPMLFTKIQSVRLSKGFVWTWINDIQSSLFFPKLKFYVEKKNTRCRYTFYTFSSNETVSLPFRRVSRNFVTLVQMRFNVVARVRRYFYGSIRALCTRFALSRAIR